MRLQIDNVRHDAGPVKWYEEAERESPVWTLILVGYGKCLYWVEGEKLLLEKGDLALIPDHTVFYGKTIPSISHEKYVVTFSHEDGASMLPLLGAHRYIRLRTGKYELLLSRMQSMKEQWIERHPYYQTMCQALLLETLTHMNREVDEGEHSSIKYRHTELMKTYIQNHYREKVTKEHLAAVIEKSPNHAAVLFREVTGQTISDYVNALRIKTAVYLLRHSQRAIADIADYLGYCDASYFHRVFKRETGRAPSAYVMDREPAQL
ncbi:AraC family transcriptional regulator [Paenibacillus allorhizosphaerae]|uniref:HTH-type transcriptional activator RhaR n=1 Tax=Paenibacillus allorhizosphaerae TaxID=2849866 RepID=A0ABM8VMQ7_9BACL|nr:AraC family transcriptional regulator [Paenibacillus allorhizosphaerae]CAG7650045.1 HTH-type transcriptional activator RhaR [Paenibacillus allorhizosphaerae]